MSKRWWRGTFDIDFINPFIHDLGVMFSIKISFELSYGVFSQGDVLIMAYIGGILLLLLNMAYIQRWKGYVLLYVWI